MLDALRRGATGWLAKILLSLLIVSFAIWGVADVFTGFGRGSIAHVGDEEITAAEFQRSYQIALNNISAQARKRISAEEARAFGLDREVLRGVIAQAALKSQSKDLGLGLSDEALIDGLKSDAEFHGPDGKFSKATFQEILRENGLSEQGFLAIRRQNRLQEHITGALNNAVALPQAMIDVEHAWREEARVVEFVQIDADKVIKVADPDEVKIKETYEQNKSQFVTPELRKFTALILSTDDLKAEVAVGEEEIKQKYEETKATFDKPERRRIQQIAFKDKAAAEEAKKAIAGGQGFMDAAKAAGFKEEDVNLGMIGKSQLIDKTIADAAFAIERDKVSDVIEGRFGPVLLRVIEIDPGKTSSFEEVKDKVRDRIAADRAGIEVQHRSDLVEEERNNGKTLKEIAAALKVKLVEIADADRSNKAPDGTTALDHPDATGIIDAAFSSSVGFDNEAIELPNSEGYAWIHVDAVSEPKQKPFEEVKADAKQVAIDAERNRLLTELAAKLVDRLKAGEAMDKVAADAGAKPEKTDPAITRSIEPQGLTKDAVAQAFTLPKGGAGSAATANGKSRVVFRVAEITPAGKASEAQVDRLSLELKQKLREDLFANYLAALENGLGVTINEAEFKRASGADAQQ